MSYQLSARLEIGDALDVGWQTGQRSAAAKDVVSDAHDGRPGPRAGSPFWARGGCRRAPGQGGNSNFRWELVGGGAVFVRVHEEAGREVVVAQSRLTDHLADAGVPTPRPLRRQQDGGAVAVHRGKPVVIYPHVPGRSCCQALVDEGRARQVGAVLAQLHQPGMGFSGGPGAMGTIAKLPQQLTELGDRPLAPTLASDVARLDDQLAVLLDRGVLTVPKLPLIHADLFRDNVLWTGGQRFTYQHTLVVVP